MLLLYNRHRESFVPHGTAPAEQVKDFVAKTRKSEGAKGNEVVAPDSRFRSVRRVGIAGLSAGAASTQEGGRLEGFFPAVILMTDGRENLIQAFREARGYN